MEHPKGKDDERPVDRFGDGEGSVANRLRERRRRKDNRLNEIMDEMGTHKRVPEGQ